MNLFKKTSSHWVRYDNYEWKKDDKGLLYITPAQNAKPELYNPLTDSDQMVLHAINTGVICMNQDADEQIKQNAVMDFVASYGLLGFMTALSTTPEFITYEAVYLPKNHFIKEESMTTEQYLSYFFPFDKLDDMQKDLYRQGMATFGGIAPTYHIELLEKPTIVWDFHSLLLAIQMMFSFMLTDEKSSLKVCKHCGKVFLASRPNTVFCSGQCKNQYNVYKSRKKGKKENLPDGE